MGTLGVWSVWTEKDDHEVEYGRWQVCTAKSTHFELAKVDRSLVGEEIWPHWSDGVPTKLRKKVVCAPFWLKGVEHRAVRHYPSIELRWNKSNTLSKLCRNSDLLPSSSYQDEWSGIYRIFSPDRTIDRCAGKDPTGTLYLGRAGGKGGNWSILRTRIMQILRREHHAINNWSFSTVLQQKYPWESLALEWTYTDLARRRERFFQNQEPFPEAQMGERWLLQCYKDSFGELPPWNEKG
jgi:hypothetical protein